MLARSEEADAAVQDPGTARAVVAALRSTLQYQRKYQSGEGVSPAELDRLIISTKDREQSRRQKAAEIESKLSGSRPAIGTSEITSNISTSESSTKAQTIASKASGNGVSSPQKPSNPNNSSSRSQGKPGKHRLASSGGGRRLDDDEIDFSSGDEVDPVHAGSSLRNNSRKTNSGTISNNSNITSGTPRVIEDPSIYGVPPRKTADMSASAASNMTVPTSYPSSSAAAMTTIKPSDSHRGQPVRSMLVAPKEDGYMQSIPPGNSSATNLNTNASTHAANKKAAGYVVLSTDQILASARLNEDVGFSSDDDDGRGNSIGARTAQAQINGGLKKSRNNKEMHGDADDIPRYGEDDLLAHKSGTVSRGNIRSTNNSGIDNSGRAALDDDYDIDRAAVIPHGTLRVARTPGMPPPAPNKGTVHKPNSAVSSSANVSSDGGKIVGHSTAGKPRETRQSHSAGGAVGAARALKSTLSIDSSSHSHMGSNATGQTQGGQQKRKGKTSRKEIDFDADDDEDDEDTFGQKNNHFHTSRGRSAYSACDDIVSGGMALDDGDGERLLFSSAATGGPTTSTTTSSISSTNRNGGTKPQSSSSRITAPSSSSLSSSSKLGLTSSGGSVAPTSGSSRVIIKPGQRIQVRPGGKR